MKSQFADLAYGYEKENQNHARIERCLGVQLAKLDKYHTMDWKEIQEEGDETPPWYVEQKARKLSYAFCREHYFSPKGNLPSCLIGKHKIDFMENNGNGVVFFDFTDKLMYWVYDGEEYRTFEVEEKFVRGNRVDYVDKPSPVVHIPLSILKECPP